VGRHIFQRIAVTDDRVTDVDAYRVYAEALGGAGPSGLGAQIPPVLLKYV